MIEISAFGSFQIAVDGQALPLSSRKAQAALTYLAGSSDQQHERIVLAELFWPELPETAALNNLSKALSQIRKVFKQAETAEIPIETTRHSVRMVSAPSWRLDANQFMNMVENARESADPAEGAAYLEDASQLYRGEFLAGLSLEDSPTFEGWLLLHRENLLLMARDSYQTLADFYLERGGFEQARDYARRQLALDAWHEEAHRQLMRALDGMGQRGDALVQYETCRQILRAELGLEPEATTRELFEQIKAGTAESRLPDRKDARRPEPTWLPKRLLPLVGRKRELDVLKQDLADPACRLINIVGPGGVGKTSLALAAARQAAAGYRDGAVFVPLEHLQASPGADLHDLLAGATGAALGLTFSGREPVHQQLFRQLSEKEMLLLLDNFEHLMAVPDSSPAAPCATFLTTLLEQAPGIDVLVTSRERFAVPAEYVLPLEGLPVPDADASMPELEGDTPTASSVRLFVEQARRIQRDFRLAADNGPDIVRICRLVDGLPLGIELAARWVPHFSPSEIAAAIQEDLGFLTAESPQAAARQQSIRATFSYSWRMLAADEQQMLARLSIILGQFGREAALAVSEGSLGTLVRLQGKSLLRQESPGTYSLHPLLRQFAAEELDRQPAQDNDVLRRRYAAYFLRKLAEQGKGFNQAWTGEAIKEIGRNIENIRRAWQIALDTNSFDLLGEALHPLYHYYRIQGLFREDQQLFGIAVDAFRLLYEQDRENRLVQELLGRALLRHGRLAWILGDSEQAMRLLQEGLDHLQQAGAQRDLSRGHAYLGEAFLRAGRGEEAGELLDSALDLYRQEGDNNGIATTLELQAVCASQGGYFDKANRLFQESNTISRRGGNRRLEGRGLHDWGLLLLRQGKIEKAETCFRDSLVIARELNLHMPIAFNQSMLARTDRQCGRYNHAHRRLISSLAVLEGRGYAFYTIRALNMLGEVEAILGQCDEAQMLLEKAQKHLNDMQTAVSDIFEGLALDFLTAVAFLFANTGREEQAGQALQPVLQHAAPGSDLDQRAQQLVGRLPIQAADEDTAPGNAQIALKDLLHRIRL